MESERFELVVMELAKQNLVPRLIETIDYPAYKRCRLIEKRLEQTLKKKASLDVKESKPQDRRFKISPTALISAAIISGILLLAMLAYFAGK